MTDPFHLPDRDPGDFKRLSGGAPRVSHPDDPSKMTTYRRPSGFAIDPNPYNLLKWKERQLTIGLLTMLGDEVHDLDLDDRDSIDRLIADAYNASDTGLAAERGTHVHTLTEHADRHSTIPADLTAAGEALGIPAPLQHHITERWLAFRHELGVGHAYIEEPLVCDRYRAAGTVDRIDVAFRDIETPFGTLHQGDRFVGDIKTGSLTTDSRGPKYWVKYGPQLLLYADAVRYDVTTDTRVEWDLPPRLDVALLYHFPLAAAIDGEDANWSAIPVNLHVARIGVDVAVQAREYAARRDVFGPPLETRRHQLRQRYHQLAPVDQERFVALGVDRDDLDAVEAALDQVDPFCQVTEPQPRQRTA